MSRHIEFLAYYGHQRQFYHWLAENLPEDLSGEVTEIYPLIQRPGFWRALAGFSRAPAGEIVALASRKYTVNHGAKPLMLWGQRMLARGFYRYFLRRFRRNRPDLLVVWNGLQLPLAAAVAAARKVGVKTLFCENGYLPRTVVMDPKGVNAAGSLMGRPAAFYRDVAVDADKLAAIYAARPVARGFNPKAQDTPEADTFTPPAHFVFLPLQVHDDSQILLYSPRFQDMPALVDAMAKAVKAVGGGLKLVVKEHPSDYGRIDYSDLRAAYPEILFTRTYPTQDLIAAADAVATVNSTVGIEAVLAKKPVLTLGSAFYNVPGVVRPLGAEEDVADALRETLHTAPDQDLRDQFLYYLRYAYLVALDKRAAPDADPGPAIQRLRDMVA